MKRKNPIPGTKKLRGENTLNAALYNAVSSLRWLAPRLRKRGLDTAANACRSAEFTLAVACEQHAEQVNGKKAA